MDSETPEDFFAPDPVELDIGFGAPRGQRRVSVALRGLLLLPHVVVAVVLGALGAVLAAVGWFTALALGRLPRWIAVYELGAIAYTIRVSAYAFLLIEDYPPLSLAPAAYPITVEIRASRLSRLRVLFRWPLAIPAAVVVYVLTWRGVLHLKPLWLITLALGSVFPAAVTSILASSGLVVFSVVAWVTTLILGRLPQSMFSSAAAVIRYQARTWAYTGLVTDFYPRRLSGDSATDWAPEGLQLPLSERAKWLTGLIVALGIAAAVAGPVLGHELTLPPPRNPAVVAAERMLDNAAMNAVAVDRCDLRCERAHERTLGEAYLGFASHLSRITFAGLQRTRVPVLIFEAEKIGLELIAASKSKDGGRAQGWDPADPGDSNGLDEFYSAMVYVLGPAA